MSDIRRWTWRDAVRCKVGHHAARLCWWLYDRLRGVDELGNRLNKWAYKCPTLPRR